MKSSIRGTSSRASMSSSIDSSSSISTNSLLKPDTKVEATAIYVALPPCLYGVAVCVRDISGIMAAVKKEFPQ